MIYFQKHLDVIIQAKDGQIKALETELERFRLQVDYERKRADRAIDELLLEKGSRPVSPPSVKKIEDRLKGAINEICQAGMEVGEPS